MKIYVGNLSKKTTEQEVRDLFAKVGTVRSVRLLGTDDTHLGRAFAFVEMPSEGEGENAIAQLHHAVFGGELIRVGLAKERGREEDRRGETIRASIGATRPYHTRRMAFGGKSGFRSPIF